LDGCCWFGSFAFLLHEWHVVVTKLLGWWLSKWTIVGDHERRFLIRNFDIIITLLDLMTNLDIWLIIRVTLILIVFFLSFTNIVIIVDLLSIRRLLLPH